MPFRMSFPDWGSRGRSDHAGGGERLPFWSGWDTVGVSIDDLDAEFADAVPTSPVRRAGVADDFAALRTLAAQILEAERRET